MKQDIAMAWVADLRQGPKQARGHLYDGKGHCCLGRLCLVVGETFVENEGFVDKDVHPYFVKGTVDGGILPKHVRDKVGMTSAPGVLHFDYLNLDNQWCMVTIELSELNDDGFTFAQIADIIEQHWEEL